MPDLVTIVEFCRSHRNDIFVRATDDEGKAVIVRALGEVDTLTASSYILKWWQERRLPNLHFIEDLHADPQSDRAPARMSAGSAVA
jgi:hypothetical protein